jgi:micrococcal nuclease
MRIIDGDTLWIDLDLGFRLHHEVDIRLAHVNTPETINFTAKGLVDPAAVYVSQCVPPGSSVIVDIVKQEKYGRWLAVIYFVPGETDRMKILQNARVLNTELVEKGFAKAYEGGKK